MSTGIEVYEDSEWKKLLASSVKLSKSELKSLGPDVSESEEEMEFECEKAKAGPAPKKKTATKRTAGAHSISSDSETEEDGASPAKKAKASPPVKAGTPKKKTALKKRRQKCKYWDKCYRKDDTHKTTFKHPDDGKCSNCIRLLYNIIAKFIIWRCVDGDGLYGASFIC